MERDIDAVLDAYLAALDFTDGPEEDAADGFRPELFKRAREDVEDFLDLIDRSGVDSTEWSDEELGHDFWMTRQRHGTGFWDRGREYGEKLTDLAHTYAMLDVYMDEYGLLWVEG